MGTALLPKVCISLALGWGVLACNQTFHSLDPVGVDAAALCHDYCARFSACGTILATGVPDCEQSCQEQYAIDEPSTRASCHCTMQLSCTAQRDYQSLCLGAPDPAMTSSSSDGGEMTTGAPGTTTATGDPTTPGCSSDAECPHGQGCVAAKCELRCHSSCDCLTGQSCTFGYCTGPARSSQSSNGKSECDQ